MNFAAAFKRAALADAVGLELLRLLRRAHHRQVDDFAGLGCVLALNGIVNNGGASGIAGVGIDRKPAAGDGCGPILAGSEFITTGPVPVGLPIDPNETINTHNGSSPITIGGLFLAREFNNSVDAPSTLAMLLLGLLLTPKMLHRRR